MDESLAKGYTNQFIRDLKKNIFNKYNDIDELEKKIRKKKNFIDKIYNLLNSDWNNFSINHCLWGSKKSSKLALTFLESSFYEHNDGGKEVVLKGKSQIYTSNPDFFYDIPNTFLISHHVIQRIFQRQTKLALNDFNKCFQLINQEFKYLPFSCLLWQIFEMHCSLDIKKALLSNSFKNKIHGDANDYIINNLKNTDFEEEMFANINFVIPTDFGLILCERKKQALNLRTYVTDKMLTPNQRNLKTNLINLSSFFIKDFYFQYDWFINNHNKLFSNLDDYNLFIYIEYILNTFFKDNIKYLVRNDKDLEFNLTERFNEIVNIDTKVYPMLKEKEKIDDLKEAIKTAGLNKVAIEFKRILKSKNI